MPSVEAIYNDLKTTGHKKVAGEHSLTVGEIVFTLLGIALMFYGTKAGLRKGWCLPAGLVMIFIGEWVF